MTLSDTLAALSEAATQGEWYADCEQVWSKNGPQVCDAVSDIMCSDAALIVALVNAYRTGQLVPVPSVERVAEGLREGLRSAAKAPPGLRVKALVATIEQAIAAMQEGK